MKYILTTFIVCLYTIALFAQDRYFARTYNSNVLPKGVIDLEFWHTSRIGHLNQYYHAQDQRIEIEFGLGDNLQTAFYFNNYHTRFSNSMNRTTTESEIGFSNEWKWKLADPIANKIGFALYGEWGLKGGDELELETKIILDKIIDKNIFAFNAVYEYEKKFDWKEGKTKSNSWEQLIEFDLAYQYLISPTFGLGLEVSNHNDISKDDGWEHSVFFGGPTLNFREGKWFAILNYLPQWGNVYKTDIAPFNNVLDMHERAELRLIFGVTL